MKLTYYSGFYSYSLSYGDKVLCILESYPPPREIDFNSRDFNDLQMDLIFNKNIDNAGICLKRWLNECEVIQ